MPQLNSKRKRSFPEALSPAPTHTSSQTCLTDLLSEQARLRPNDTAVVHGGDHMTYRELVLRASGLAGHLNRLGVAADDRVGLLVEPSADLVVGTWGILFAGAAYLPLAPDYPQERLRYMVEDSRTRVIVVQRHLVDRLEGLVADGTRIVVLEEVAGSTEIVPPGPRPGDLAYVIYTSGSTGKPKGVMIEHRSIVSQMRWMRTCGHLSAEAVVLQKTPMSFDAAQWEILSPAVGARVVAGTPGLHRSPEDIVVAVMEHGVTTLQCVPTLLQALLDTDGFSRCATLRRVFSGGEALSRRLAAEFCEALPWSSLANLYGPTECAINATACLVDAGAIDERTGTIPIGVPVDNTQCFILDENLAPVDIGEEGELYIGGVQLARGYLNRPELTRERFIPSPFVPTQRLYRTGDLAHWNPDGTIQFSGRVDHQVKLRGHRVELEEVSLAIEEHSWVRRAAAIVTDDARTGFQNLVACIELDTKEAALMDQGNHGAHHQSKESRLQVRAQLSDPGVRTAAELRGRPVIGLPSGRDPKSRRRRVFGRKTYRFYEGGRVRREDLLELLAPRPTGGGSRGLDEVSFTELGEILRWFGQYHSDLRLLPKYAYASPGALYAAQMYLETGGVAGLDPGVYYHHPVDHSLVRVGDAQDGAAGRLLVHFVGRRRAIEPVYQNNILEVLELETGHMVGVFEDVLPDYGLEVLPLEYRPTAKDRTDVADEDHYLGTFEITRRDPMSRPDSAEVYVQVHGRRVEGLAEGLYRYSDGGLERVSDDVVQRRHVIAINQQVYERAAFGVIVVAEPERSWLEYVVLGTRMHHLQSNDRRLGLMSSGYSSKSGTPLPAARRVDDILVPLRGAPGASYFALGGKVSEEQFRSEDMNEDSVHMKGPAEMVRDELSRRLPDYMVPNRVLVLDELPLTANGKVDRKALAASETVRSTAPSSVYVAPKTPFEHWLAGEWGKALRYEDVSMEDDFFAAGGNSLIAVALVRGINRALGIELPLQVLFEFPKLADLAARTQGSTLAPPASRLVSLGDGGEGSPVFCWPGLGGYPMNLRLLALEAGLGRPFYGVQAHGVNIGEDPYSTIRETAAADIAEIRRVRPEGPYTLWGYSFGARVAFEAAWQLEQAGERVENLMLLCPGNPRVEGGAVNSRGREASYENPAYVTILFSVFSGSASGHELDLCLKEVRDEDGFVVFVHERFPELGEEMIRRITRIVERTFEFEYTFHELAERRLKAPVTVFKAAGDDYSFIDGESGYSAVPPTIVDLEGDHYEVLREHGVAELVSAIRARLGE